MKYCNAEANQGSPTLYLLMDFPIALIALINDPKSLSLAKVIIWLQLTTMT